MSPASPQPASPGWRRELSRTARLAAPLAAGHLATGMIGRVDDTMVATIGVTGTPEECAVEIRKRFAGVGERVAVYFPGYDVRPEHLADLVRALHDETTTP